MKWTWNRIRWLMFNGQASRSDHALQMLSTTRGWGGGQMMSSNRLLWCGSRNQTIWGTRTRQTASVLWDPTWQRWKEPNQTHASRLEMEEQKQKGSGATHRNWVPDGPRLKKGGHRVDFFFLLQADEKAVDGGMLPDANGMDPNPGGRTEGSKWQKPRLSRKSLMKCCLVKWIIASTTQQGPGTGTRRDTQTPAPNIHFLPCRIYDISIDPHPSVLVPVHNTSLQSSSKSVSEWAGAALAPISDFPS